MLMWTTEQNQCRAVLSYGNESFISAGGKFLGWLSGLQAVRKSLCFMQIVYWILNE
jgi:hypothetical protein